MAAGATLSRAFDVLSVSHGWYDRTVTTSADSTYSRRFVGHVESGLPSITG